ETLAKGPASPNPSSTTYIHQCDSLQRNWVRKLVTRCRGRKLAKHGVRFHFGRIGDDIGIHSQGRHRDDFHDFGLTELVLTERVVVSVNKLLWIPLTFQTKKDD